MEAARPRAARGEFVPSGKTGLGQAIFKMLLFSNDDIKLTPKVPACFVRS
jgi:hypothetical protein